MFYLIFLSFFTILSGADQNLPPTQNATPIEQQIVLISWQKTKSFLNSLGIPTSKLPKIVFEDTTNVEGANSYGYYDSDKNEIYFIHFPSKITAFGGLPWTEAMMESFMIHEMSHAIFVSYMDDKESEIARSWHEGVAYYVQLSLMDEELRKSVLKKMNNPAPYTNALSINDLNYAISPDEFSISTYFYFKNQADQELIKKIAQLKVAEAMKNFFF